MEVYGQPAPERSRKDKEDDSHFPLRFMSLVNNIIPNISLTWPLLLSKTTISQIKKSVKHDGLVEEYGEYTRFGRHGGGR